MTPVLFVDWQQCPCECDCGKRVDPRERVCLECELFCDREMWEADDQPATTNKTSDRQFRMEDA